MERKMGQPHTVSEFISFSSYTSMLIVQRSCPSEIIEIIIGNCCVIHLSFCFGSAAWFVWRQFEFRITNHLVQRSRRFFGFMDWIETASVQCGEPERMPSRNVNAIFLVHYAREAEKTKVTRIQSKYRHSYPFDHSRHTRAATMHGHTSQLNARSSRGLVWILYFTNWIGQCIDRNLLFEWNG